MKTIVKNEVYQRVEELEADLKVKSGWKFAPKSEWKKSVRDIAKVERVAKPDRPRPEPLRRRRGPLRDGAGAGAVPGRVPARLRRERVGLAEA